MRAPTVRHARLLALAAALLVPLAAPGLVTAADEGPHDKAIEARQAMFRLYSWNFGTLADMAKEKIPYDADRASAAAANLERVVDLEQGDLWPPGSDSETAGNATNRALPAIWEEFPDVVSKGDALTEAVAALQTAAGGGLDALQGAVGDVGGSCKGCHDDYRAERD